MAEKQEIVMASPDSAQRPQCCGKPMKKNSRTAAGRIRYQCSYCGRSTTGSGESSEHPGYDPAASKAYLKRLREEIKAGQRKFVVTAAQNNTRPHLGFLEALERYCAANGARLIVIPVHYKNISLYTAAQQYKKAWAAELQPYLIDGRLQLGGGVCVRADVKIQATAANPLSGLQPLTGKSWSIYGHSQVAMEPIATPATKRPGRSYTTGAITVENYSQTKDGAKAKFHHVMGALVVEVDKRRRHAFVRQINAERSGAFYDLDAYYTPEKITRGHRALAIVPGDEHVKHLCPRVRHATYDGKHSIVNTLRPEYIVRHDVLDAYACSHHHEKDPITQFLKYWNRDHDMRAELDDVVEFINSTTPEDAETLIVPSNHHDHLGKWLARADDKTDHQNAMLIQELRHQQRQSGLKGGTTDPFELYLRPRLTCKFTFLDRNTQHLLAGVDHSQHGDVGVNGSRGSARALANTTHKVNVGHSHGARIVKSVYQGGTSTVIPLEYMRGLSEASNTHTLEYQNGKRTLLDIINGKWRGE